MNEDLQRVKKKLDQHVLDFLAERKAANETFTVDQFRRFNKRSRNGSAEIK